MKLGCRGSNPPLLIENTNKVTEVNAQVVNILKVILAKEEATEMPVELGFGKPGHVFTFYIARFSRTKDGPVLKLGNQLRDKNIQFVPFFAILVEQARLFKLDRQIREISITFRSVTEQWYAVEVYRDLSQIIQ